MDALMRELVRVEEVVRETPTMTTLRFEYKPVVKPGQFVMVWVPGDDEVPMSLSYLKQGQPKGFTVKSVGETTRRLTGTKKGDLIGIRGPYGTCFEPGPRRVLVVAGGSGAAMLAPAAEAAAQSGAKVTVALGAKTASELLFKGRFRKAANQGLHVTTDDGTEGSKGFVTDLASRLISQGDQDVMWTCGPEVMMAMLLPLCREKGLKALMSVERVMKCAINICDSCAMGPYHVCVEGPVFDGSVLAGVEDFGKFKRNMSGCRVEL
jgi:dihydroorotate dehydrogenase electron transfer subunit